MLETPLKRIQQRQHMVIVQNFRRFVYAEHVEKKTVWVTHRNGGLHFALDYC